MDCFTGDCARQTILEPIEQSEADLERLSKWNRIMSLNHHKLEHFFATRFRRSSSEILHSETGTV